MPAEQELDADGVIGAQIAIVYAVHDSAASAGEEIHRVYGVVAELEDTMQVAADVRNYTLTVVPRMWLASMIETLEIYMGQSVPDIVQQKLELLDLSVDTDFEMRLSADYPPREFVVQYKENDLDFIKRLCEHWGIAFFFEHRGGRDVVVFSDENTAFTEISSGAMPYAPKGEKRGLTRLSSTRQIVPKHFVQRDYNYRNPSVDLTGDAELDGGFAGGVIEYGGHFKSDAEAKRFAEMRAQERRVDRIRFSGSSAAPDAHPGVMIDVLDHPTGDQHLIVCEVTHALQQTAMMGGAAEREAYRADFRAIDKDVVYRPPRITPKPRVQGMLTGIVDAASKGKYAELDDDGRYRIKFMFDTSGPDEGKASRPLRMMQPHSGSGYGMHFPLRPGVEVLLTFVDGDPDRPIIAGTVPNPQTGSPVVADNAKRNVIRTGGGNEINIDDDEGNERIKLTTPNSDTTFSAGRAQRQRGRRLADECRRVQLGHTRRRHADLIGGGRNQRDPRLPREWLDHHGGRSAGVESQAAQHDRRRRVDGGHRRRRPVEHPGVARFDPRVHRGGCERERSGRRRGAQQ